MTIRELFYKYRNTVAPNHTIEIVYDNGLKHKDMYEKQNIIYLTSPEDSTRRVEIIWDIFTNTNPGVSIYMSDSSDEFVEILKQKYTNDIEELKRGEEDKQIGISIQHIYKVGYIISLVSVSTFFTVEHYTAEEYDKLANEYVVIGMAKNEKHYIKDWVAYHLRIGFDKIYLFDNNEVNGETYNDLLSEYIKSGKLKLIDIRGRKGMQNPLYNAFYYSHPFKWLAVIDIDEFIWFNETGNYNNIKDFLDNRCLNKDKYGVMLQWHCYGPSGDDKPSNKPIWEVNTKLLPFNVRKDCRCEYIHDWCKTIYKVGYRLTLNEHFGWENAAQGDSYYVCENDCDDKPIVKSNLIHVPEDKFKSQDVFIKHFMLRNIHDFYYNKYFRGHAGADFGVGIDGWHYYQWMQNLNYYTDIVDTLTEKEQIYLEKHGMKMNYTFHPDVFVNWYILKGNDHINSVVNKILCDSLLPFSNCFINKIMIDGVSANLPTDESMNNPEKDYDLGFIATTTYNNDYFDVSMEDPGTIRKNIQDPVVINIGIPLKYAVLPVSIEEQKQYADFLSIVFATGNLNQFIRGALDYGVTTIPKIGIMDNSPSHMGYGEGLDKFLAEINLKAPSKVLFNNTMVMPFQQYRKLKKFQKDFTKQYGWYSNESICNNIEHNYTTPYHAYICSVMSIIDKPYYVWP